MEQNTREDVRRLVTDFFVEECEIAPEAVTDGTRIIEDLDGDSLMLLSLLERACKRYGVTIELKEVGRHLMRKPAHTVGDIIALTMALMEHGDRILDVDL